MTKEQAVGLFTEAGFTVSSKGVTNRCGGASNPRVAFGDLNGDGRPEAHVADVDPKCYGKPGAYFAILAQQSDGTWKRLIAEDGIVGFDKARTSGWSNLTLDTKDSACPGVRRFNGTDYGPATACARKGSAIADQQQQAAPSASPQGRTSASSGGSRSSAVSQTKLFNWSDDQSPEAKALSAAERNAIFKAAGVRQVGGGKWTGCVEDPSGHSFAQLALYNDVNGDGRPEAAILDHGSYCNGFVGVRSTVMTRTSGGTWKIMLTSQGFVNFLVSRGADNFPDIEIGMPGFCFPYRRWNGTEYPIVAMLDDNGKPCRPN